MSSLVVDQLFKNNGESLHDRKNFKVDKKLKLNEKRERAKKKDESTDNVENGDTVSNDTLEDNYSPVTKLLKTEKKSAEKFIYKIKNPNDSELEIEYDELDEISVEKDSSHNTNLSK